MNRYSIDGKRAVIIGGGPAGLTAALELSKHSVPATVLEADKQVGGIARTVNYKGYLFDIGGHRFFTKWDEVNQIWNDVLGDKFLERPRLSRIYYNKKFFIYPLVAKNALFGLGIFESVRILASYIKARLMPTAKEENLEEWVSNRFGRRLYEIFFKTYTEKVWGVPCTTIRAEWAAQRIKGLSLLTAIRNAILPTKTRDVKTLIDRFQYPERGPGQMWETLTDQLNSSGYPVLMEHPVVQISHQDGQVTHLITEGPNGMQEFWGTDFISSMPIRELVNVLDPAPPQQIVDAAAKLRYRDFLIISLIVNRKEVAPDNWIYVHDSSVKVGRIQNFKNWSPAMVPDPTKTCLGMEYFVFENDELWSSPDDKLIEMAKREIVQLGLVRAEEIEDGTVVRMQKAYPMYDEDWSTHVDTIRSWISDNARNLQLVGRNGMHKYNNQDHSMITALYAARNICGADYDLWAVNTEPDYHEEKKDEHEDGTPKRAASRPMRSQRGYDLEQLKLMTSRNQSLDVLRGIAVLLVIVSHYSITLPRSSAFYETGAVGVDLFFVLSGFLISGLLFSEFRKSGTIRLKRFWIRRGFKIYPPFYALVALTAIAALVGSHQFPSQLLWEFVFLQNYGHPFWPHTWSLAVEEHFYFLLPMLLLLLIRVGKSKPNPFRAIPFISMGLSLICLYLRILALWRGNDWGHIAFPTHLRIDALFAGVTLGYYAHFTPESFREAGKSWVLAFGLFFAATFVIMPDVPRLTFAYVAFSFIVAWAVNRSPSKNPLAKGLSWIGYYSYSIYLWHVVAMLGLEHLPARWFRFPLYFVAAISLGVLMAKVIEVPALRLRDKVFPSSSLVTSTRPRSEGTPIPATAVVGKGLARI